MGALLWKGGSWRQLPLPTLVVELTVGAAALLSHHPATAGSGSVVIGSAKTHTSNFHTICKCFIPKAFLFNIKQVGKKFYRSLAQCQTSTGIWRQLALSCMETSVGFLKWLNGEQYISLLKSHMPFGLNIKVPLRLSKY